MPLLDHATSWRPASQVSSVIGSITVWPERLRRGVFVGLGIIALQILGCESKVEIATFRCPPPSKASLLGSAGAPGSALTSESFALPWSTGFENGFCDYGDAGFCLSTGPTRKSIVTEPVHDGSFAAAFTVDSSKSDHQARCIRQGNLPTAAYYSGWYYVPQLASLVQTDDSTASDFSGWNLFHFQGEGGPMSFHWDVSLVNKDNGDLRLEVFSYQFPPLPPDQSSNPSIPIGAWFKIEMYLKRAADETGEVIVYQDDAVIFQLSNLVTDRSNSPSGQWYVGNFAKNLDPPESTVYVDDVKVSATR